MVRVERGKRAFFACKARISLQIIQDRQWSRRALQRLWGSLTDREHPLFDLSVNARRVMVRGARARKEDGSIERSLGLGFSKPLTPGTNHAHRAADRISILLKCPLRMLLKQVEEVSTLSNIFNFHNTPFLRSGEQRKRSPVMEFT
ncbi:hypothetical protein Krac_10695 [Ktedonobacter racemifer DSM 44963]|uniref:Uncharacterized protein n=1 Tax=Ktedonobacter racemifer DSM 44963 TaxID=485913 RepID=D6TI99_KTERA|nr:hypothetical protein Krac_1165 [Ktedonobacter racemifer DSM 44963]EFH85016.1 hypothetical protein Krac_6149 [Ktedonobacter racemifer DSM 44963]EFH85772.1 hypothetical protein Krac_7010 [Ktedonobacter racemifer DSM 44963]EFH89156.1 hypothetical protein Krac_10695 [Ktedonobacter racemifer DSM 44963]